MKGSNKSKGDLEVALRTQLSIRMRFGSRRDGSRLKCNDTKLKAGRRTSAEAMLSTV